MEQKVQVIFNNFKNLTTKQKKQFNVMECYYLAWNEKINLISRKDIVNLYTHHILHSLSIAKAITFEPGTSVLDVGTGGGFPGIPLAIMLPHVQFHLVDTITKKINVVKDIAQSLGLTNINTSVQRAETIQEKYHFIVGRGVTALPQFYNWIKKNIAPNSSHTVPNGLLYLKGGDVEKELQQIDCSYHIYHLATWFSAPFFSTKKLIYIYYS